MIEHRDVIVDEAPSRSLPRSFPHDLQHVSVDLSPSHYDVGPRLNPTNVSLSTLPIMARQTNDDNKDLIHDSSSANPTEAPSPILNASSNTPLVAKQFNDDEEDFLIDLLI